MKTLTILGIETSCDETGAAIASFDPEKQTVLLLSNTVASSMPLHAATGGIIPETAAREQIKYILPVINETMQKAYKKPLIEKTHIPVDAIAVTVGPGLIGSLLVGVETARTLAYLWQKPLIAVNHLYGHIYANWIMDNSEWKMDQKPKRRNHSPFAIRHLPTFPALALVVSGGHTDFVLMRSHDDITVIGATRDDAAGEAFDKIGRLLGLPYPAGPYIAKLAQKGDSKRFSLPRPMIGSHDFDVSFSGLKTAVYRLLEKNPIRNEQEKADIAASVQETIIKVLVRKTEKALERFNISSLLLGGGVGANELLRTELQMVCAEKGVEFFVPRPEYCTDNAAMIAAAGFFTKNQSSWQEISADPELYY